MSTDNFFKNYKRKLIQIHRDMAILIHIFEKDPDHSFEDAWLHDLTGVYETDLEALRDECDKRIEQDLIDCGLKKNENENSSN